MATALSLFPARVRVVDQNGYAKPEFLRALSIVFSRVGGAMGDAGGGDVIAAMSQAFEETGSYESVTQTEPQEDTVGEMVMQPPVDFQAELDLKEDKINKNAANGYAGLDALRALLIYNSTGTYKATISAETLAADRAQSLPDRAGTFALTTDITGAFQAANFTGYSISGVPGATGTIDLTTAVSIDVASGIITGYT